MLFSNIYISLPTDSRRPQIFQTMNNLWDQIFKVLISKVYAIRFLRYRGRKFWDCGKDSIPLINKKLEDQSKTQKIKQSNCHWKKTISNNFLNKNKNNKSHFILILWIKKKLQESSTFFFSADLARFFLNNSSFLCCLDFFIPPL